MNHHRALFTSTHRANGSKRRRLGLLAATMLVLLASPAAHALYKVVNPDGSISYTDRPPQNDKAKVSAVDVQASSGGSDVALPYEVRQAAQKFPVTLYTVNGCNACNEGRAYLQRRGIPFSERLATTPASKAEWQKATGTSDAPVLMVGKERLAGYQSNAWASTLDAAGYPANAKLPSTYKSAATEIAKPPPAPAAPAPKAERSAMDRPATESGPGGIRF